jgi:hypothetical protein
VHITVEVFRMNDTSNSEKGQPGLTKAAQEAIATELPAIEAAIRRILGALDTKVEPCCSCGLKVARSYNDARAAEMFRATLRRVEAYRQRV